MAKQRRYLNDKKNDVNVNNLPTENSNTTVPTTAVLKKHKQPAKKLRTKKSVFFWES